MNNVYLRLLAASTDIVIRTYAVVTAANGEFVYELRPAPRVVTKQMSTHFRWLKQELIMMQEIQNVGYLRLVTNDSDIAGDFIKYGENSCCCLVVNGEGVADFHCDEIDESRLGSVKFRADVFVLNVDTNSVKISVVIDYCREHDCRLLIVSRCGIKVVASKKLTNVMYEIGCVTSSLLGSPRLFMINSCRFVNGIECDRSEVSYKDEETLRFDLDSAYRLLEV